MFPKANKEDNKPKDQVVKEEVKAENNGVQPIGNEGMQHIPPVDPGAGNEAMNAQIVNQALNIINNQEQAPNQDLYYDQMEQKPLFYQDPEEPVQEPPKSSVEGLDDLNDALDRENPLNKDMIVNRPKKKKIKKKNKDISRINNQMKRIGGLNFNVQKLPEREKTSG